MLVREVQTEDLEKINNFLISNKKKPIKLTTWNYLFINNPHLKKVINTPPKSVTIGTLFSNNQTIIKATKVATIKGTKATLISLPLL